MNDQKTIVIAGASSGIGAALARALAADGHRLYICARRAERLAEIAEGFPSIYYSTCDVSDELQVENFYQDVQALASSVDVLIYSVGIFGPIGRANEVDSDEWFAAIRTNVFGAYLMAKHVVPLMQTKARPRILMMSGGGAFNPLPRASGYGVSKAAIVRLMETMAIELAPKIAVNAIAPGFVTTEIHRHTLAAGPERGGEHYETTVKQLAEAADSIEIPINCVRFMISDASSKLTGKTISAKFDPWEYDEFSRSLDVIMNSPLYSSERITLAHMHDPRFAKLAEATSSKEEVITKHANTLNIRVKDIAD